MKWLLFGGGIVLAGLTTLYFVNRSQPQESVAELPENPDNSFAQSVQGEIDLERQRVNEDYWNRWGKENIVTMADKMWDYQMDRYDLWEEGKIDRFRWNNAMMPPSIFY
jgi:hypothetical protein